MQGPLLKSHGPKVTRHSVFGALTLEPRALQEQLLETLSLSGAHCWHARLPELLSARILLLSHLAQLAGHPEPAVGRLLSVDYSLSQ